MNLKNDDSHQMTLKTHETKNISEITQKILNTPESITSDDFMALYDTIYTFCAQYTKTFEILGAPIYTLLANTISTHCENLEKFGSLETFNNTFLSYEKSTTILVNAYSYLQRFYISNCMIRKDNFSKEVKPLLNFYFYKNYLDGSKDILENLILMEMKNYKAKKKEIKTAINSYKTLLESCEEGTRFKQFKMAYLKEIEKKINFKENIFKMLVSVYKEISLITSVFDSSSQSSLSKNVVRNCDQRINEIVEFVLQLIEKDKNFYYAFKILDVMGSNAMAIFIEQFENFLENLLKNAEDFFEILSKFEKIHGRIKKDFFLNKKVKVLIIKKFRCAILKLFEKKDPFVIDQAVSAIESLKNNEISAKQILLSFIYPREPLLNHLILKMQKRILLSNFSIENENSILNNLTSIFPAEELCKIKKVVADANFSDSLNCTLFSFVEKNRTNDCDYKIKPVILTRGFWELKQMGCNLHHKLKISEEKISSLVCGRSKRSEIEFFPNLSAVVLNINDFKIKMCSSKATIILTIDDYWEISLKMLKSMCKDSNFDENIRILEDCKIINVVNERVVLNASYSDGDLDIFDVNLSKKEIFEVRKDDLIQCEFMKFMKEIKFMEEKQVFSFFKERGCAESEMGKCLESLIENGYVCKCENGFKYVP